MHKQTDCLSESPFERKIIAARESIAQERKRTASHRDCFQRSFREEEITEREREKGKEKGKKGWKDIYECRRQQTFQSVRS